MPLAIALVVSALLHAAAIAVPEWDRPGLAAPEPPPLEAHLAPPPKAAPAQPKREKPKPPAHRRATPVQPAPTAEMPPAEAAAPEAEAEAETAPPAAAAEAPVVEAPAATPEPPAPPAPPAPPWGGRGSLRYTVTYGSGGFVIGEARHEWQTEDGRYSLLSTFEPKGLAAIRGKTRTQASEGEITAEGLRPLQFRDRRQGREPETASLDWQAGKVVFSGGRGEAALPPGAEDLLSVFYQLAWLSPRQSVDMTVATSSRVGRWTFEYLGEETLALPSGPTPALHLRTRAEGDTTEVWLDTKRGGLPVQIRHTDRKGDVFEEVAQEVEIH